jgi:hypothetical protein
VLPLQPLHRLLASVQGIHPRAVAALCRHSSSRLLRKAFSSWLLADRSVSVLGLLSPFTRAAWFHRIVSSRAIGSHCCSNASMRWRFSLLMSLQRNN